MFERFGNIYSVYGAPDPEREEFYLEYFLTEPSMVFDVRTSQLPDGMIIYKDAKINKPNGRRLSMDYVNSKYRSLLTQDVNTLLKKLDEQEYVTSQCVSLGFDMQLRNDLLIVGPRGTDSVNQAVDQLKRVTGASKFLAQKYGCGMSSVSKPY